MEVHDDLLDEVERLVVHGPHEELPLVRGLARLRRVARLVPDVVAHPARVAQLDVHLHRRHLESIDEEKVERSTRQQN